MIQATCTKDNMTYSELFKLSVEKLNSAGIAEAESDVRVLFDYLINADRTFMLIHKDDEATAEEYDTIIKAISDREKRIPVQHITGYQNFMGFEFKVTKDVLVPRFDTECLVEEAMLVTNDGDKVLDVCTGSGCILISLMKYKNDIKGIGTDISEKALLIAKENAKDIMGSAYSEYENPQFIQGDLFSNILDKDFDVIVSNPPYIRSCVIDTLEPEVKEFDPMIALDGGEDGLDFYRRIVGEARNHLRKGGHLLVEIGYDQGEDVKSLFVDNGYWDVRIVKDLCGNDRVVLGRV